MIIGITGKSGAGKTTITNNIGKHFNITTINLDEIIHYVMDQHKARAIETFGSEILKDGKIDRIVLGDLVFSSRNTFKDYSTFIYKETLDVIAPYIATDCIIDHILLPHMKEIWDMCNVKILVKADDQLRQERVLSRDKISPDYFKTRESASIEYDEDDFDVIIKNNKENTCFLKIL